MVKIHSAKELYNEYREHMAKLADTRNALALMQWDQETYMPAERGGFPGAADCKYFRTGTWSCHIRKTGGPFEFIERSCRN